MTFRKANAVSLKLGEDVGRYLLGYQEVTMLVLPNICSLYVDYYNKPNSCLIIEDMGGGKSDFLKLLHNSNKKKVIQMPSKMYAIELAETFSKGGLHMKTAIHDDLIASFHGLTRKSREQLLGFWTEVLSAHSYSQLKNVVKAECNVVFGVAREFFHKQKEQLFGTTFLDRITLIQPPKKDIVMMDSILDKMEERIIKPPTIKLPTRRKKIELDWDNTGNYEKAKKLSLLMDKQRIMSATRAWNYVRNWLKGNAYLNGRTEVSNHDFDAFLQLFPLHLGKNTLFMHVYNSIREFPQLSDNERIAKLQISRDTYYKYKKGIDAKDFIIREW